MIAISVANNVSRRQLIESIKVSRKTAMIAIRGVYDCEPLQIPGAYSKIILSEKVPGSVLHACMKELNEKIIVKPLERTHQNRTGI